MTIISPAGTHDQNGSLVKRMQPCAIPVPEPIAWFPLLSSMYQPRKSTQGMPEQEGVPVTTSSTYSFEPLAPCETSLMTSCAGSAVKKKRIIPAARTNFLESKKKNCFFMLQFVCQHQFFTPGNSAA